MAHNHGNEYQVRIVHEDGTDELSGWMHGEEQLALTMAAVHKVQGNSYWLRERKVLCPDCLDPELMVIVECSIAYTPSARCRPHDSRYLLAVGSKNRHELNEVFRGIGH